MRTPMIDILTRRAPRETLLSILNANSKTFPSKVAKEVDVTYSHVVKLLAEMKRSGLVYFEKSGRMKHVGLTPKGKEIATTLSVLRTTLNG